MKRYKLGIMASLALSMLIPAYAGDDRYRPDPWITMKTKISLLTADNLSASRINVDSINGRVTLHGKVDSAADKARAEDVANRIDGVTHVRNLLQVVPQKNRKISNLEDRVINERVKAAFAADPALEDSKIDVSSVNKGVVLLTGSASSLTTHLRAIFDAAKVDGVRRVASEVQSPDTVSDREIWAEEDATRAEASAGGLKQGVSDMWITTAAKVRLMADGETPALDINVDTDNGVVTLFGVVPTERAKKAAEADVLKVSGVKKVDNALQVVPEQKQKAVEVKDDEAVKSVKETLSTHDELGDVSVEVKNGVARITGTVKTQADRLRAAVLVRSTAGVRSVNNDLQVKG